MIYNIVAVDQEQFRVDGTEYWRVDDRLYADAVYVTKSEPHAKWLAEWNDRLYFFQIEYSAEKPNKYLVELNPREAQRLFKSGKISRYFKFKKQVEGLPRCFTVLKAEETKRLNLTDGIPVRADFVGV